MSKFKIALTLITSIFILSAHTTFAESGQSTSMMNQSNEQTRARIQGCVFSGDGNTAFFFQIVAVHYALSH